MNGDAGGGWTCSFIDKARDLASEQARVATRFNH